MHQPLAMKRAWIDRVGPGTAALAVFAISLGTLLGAWYFQYVLEYPPCPLCLDERISYYIIIPLSLLLALAVRSGAPPGLIVTGFTLIVIAALCDAALAVYHSGIEWHFWPGPPDCSGPLGNIDLRGGSLLDQLKTIHVVRCDQAAWRFLGISLAGYNGLICLAMAAIAGCGVAARRPR